MDFKGHKSEELCVVSSSNVISKIHNMQWLKSGSQSLNLRRLSADEMLKVLPQKKEIEDYFSGTRSEKKQREKKLKINTFTIDALKDLEIKNDSASMSDVSKSANLCKKKSGPSDVFPTQIAEMTNVENNWNTSTNAANMLFPNAESIKVEYINEEEMMSIALAESIMTAQLEHHKFNSVEEKDNKMDRHSDSNSDDDWENVRRNLPISSETTKTENSSLLLTKHHDSNNNSKVNTKPGNQCNERKSVLKVRSEPVQVDFNWYQKTKVKELTDVPSTPKKSVSFAEPVMIELVNDISEKSQKDISTLNNTLILNNNEKVNSESVKPSASSNLSTCPTFVDKYGRVNGFTERHLFMGKGARLKEQAFLKQYDFIVEAENVKHNSSKKDSQNAVIDESEKEKVKPKKAESQESNNNKKYQNYRNDVSDQRDRAHNDKSVKKKESKNCQVSQSSKDIVNEKQNLKDTRYYQSKTESHKPLQTKSYNLNRKVTKSKIEDAVSKTSDMPNICTNNESSLFNEKLEPYLENNKSASTSLSMQDLSSEHANSNGILDTRFKAVNSYLKKSPDSSLLNGSAEIIQSTNSVKHHECIQNNVPRTLEQYSQSTESGFNKTSENTQLNVGEQRQRGDVNNGINNFGSNVTTNCYDRSKKGSVENSSIDIAYLEKCSDNVVDQSFPYYFQTEQNLQNVQQSPNMIFDQYFQSSHQNSVPPEMQYQSSLNSQSSYFNANPEIQHVVKQNMQRSTVPVVPCSNFHAQSHGVIAANIGCQNMYVQGITQSQNLEHLGVVCFNPKNNTLQHFKGEINNMEKYPTQMCTPMQNTMYLNTPLENMHQPNMLLQDIQDSSLLHQHKQSINLSSQHIQNPNLSLQNTYPDPFLKNSCSGIVSQNIDNSGNLLHPRIFLQNTGHQCLQFSNVHDPNMSLQNVQCPHYLEFRDVQRPCFAVSTNVNEQFIEIEKENIPVGYFINQEQNYPGTISNYVNSIAPSMQVQYPQYSLQKQQSTLPYSFCHDNNNSYQNLMNFNQGLPSNTYQDSRYVQHLPLAVNTNKKTNNMGIENGVKIPGYNGQYFNYLDIDENSIALQNSRNITNTQGEKINIQIEPNIDKRTMLPNNCQGSLPSSCMSREQNLMTEISSDIGMMQNPYCMQDITNISNLRLEVQNCTSNVQPTVFNTNKNSYDQDDPAMNQNWQNCNRRKQIYSGMCQDQVNDARMIKTTDNLNVRRINAGPVNFRAQNNDLIPPNNFRKESKTFNDDKGYFNIRINMNDKPNIDEEDKQCNIPPMVSPLSCMNFGMKQIGTVCHSANLSNVLRPQFNSTLQQNVNPNFG